MRQRPRILWLADRRGWAYDREGRCVARALSAAFDVELAYVQEAPDLARAEFDLLVVAFWGETYHQRFGIPPARVIKQVASHRWQNEAKYGCLSPAEFAAKHLADAGAVCAISQPLCDLIAPVRPVGRVMQNVPAADYARTAPRQGDLTFGWAGNPDDACKGLHDVLLPAVAHGAPMLLATGDRDERAMIAFYRDLDVLCIASSAEGEPRTLLEAMASGCFVIATDVGVVREWIRHEDNGLIVARSVDAFVAALAWCRAHGAQVRAAGMRNAKCMQETASDAAVAGRWRPLFLDALARLRSLDASQLCISQLGSTSAPATPAACTTIASTVARAKASYADHYSSLNAGDLGGVYAAAEFYYRAELDAVLPPATQIHASCALDVGCAYGLLLRFLHARGYGTVDGIELDARLHARARAFAGTTGSILCGDALDALPTLTARYDLVTAYDLIEHFDKDDALRFASNVRLVLAPGGCAVFRTPNMANVLGVYSRCMDLTHQVGFTEQSLTQLLQLAGFDRVELVIPQFDPSQPLTAKLHRSRAFHRELFELQDRSLPRCFDKNLVMVAHA